MQKLLFYPPSNNFYHTINKKITGQRSEKIEGEKEFQNQIISGTSVITGYYKGELNPGDVLSLGHGSDYEIVEVVERRDHKGVFKNPEDAKGGYFKVNCKYTDVIKVKN